jgi:hypothetical protein
VIGGQRGTERATSIPGSRLNPKRIDRPVTQHFAIGDTIERDAASQAQVPQPGFRNQAPNHPEDHLVGDRLNRGREIHMALLKQFLRSPRRPAEQTIKLAVRHPQPDTIIKIFLIEVKRAVRF